MRKKKSKRLKKEDNDSGILLMNEIRITPYSCEKFPVQMIVLQIIFIILATFSSLYCFISSFNLNVENIKIVMYIICSAIIWYFAFSFLRKSRKVWPFLSILVLYIIRVLFRKKQIASAFLIVLDAYLKEFNKYFATDFTVEKAILGNSGKEYVTELIIFVAIFSTMVISYIVSCYLSKFVYLLITLPFLILCFFVGVMPSTIFFLMYTCTTVAVFGAGAISNNYCVKLKEQNAKKNNNIKQKNFKDIAAIKIGVTFFIMMLIYSIIFNVFYSKKRFEKSDNIENMKTVVQATMNDIENIVYLLAMGKESPRLEGVDTSKSLMGSLEDMLSKKMSSHGGISKGAIANGSKIEFSNQGMLTVKLYGLNGTLYLRSYIGSEYINGWRKYHGEKTDVIKSIYNIETFEEGHISIIKEGEENAKDMVPYGLKENAQVTISDNGDISYNGNMQSIPYNECDFEKIENAMINGDMEEFIDNEDYDADSEYMTQEYTQVPEELYDAVSQIMGNENNYNIDEIEGDPYYKVSEIINVVTGVQNEFKKNYVYSLEVEKAKNGKDQISYFLTDSKKGYCMFYAAAATAMFRYAGIPSRYVEGYVVTQEDFKNAKESIVQTNSTETLYEMTIKDTNAHAWVEVYIDNIGWVPVEVTCASTQEGSTYQDNIADTYHNNSNTTPKVSQTPKPSTSPTSKSGSAKQDNIVQETNKSSSELVEKDNLTQSDSTHNVKIIIIIITIVCIIIIVITGIYLRKRYIEQKENRIKVSGIELVKYVTNISNIILNKKNILYNTHINYKNYAKEISTKYYIEEEKTTKYVEIILKDSFSKESITQEEYDVVKEFYNDFMEYYYKNLNKYQQWYFDNIGCIIRKL